MSTIKLLDFEVKQNTAGQITKPRRIAWPVLGYRVTLPDSRDYPDSSLNPFEKVVMRLFKAEGPLPESRLSAETCIPEDFIKSVVLRLMDNGYINDSNEIIKESCGDRALPGYKPAIVFQEQVTGRVLPFVYYNSKPKINWIDPESTQIWTMRKGKSFISGVAANDVAKAIRAQERHARAYGEQLTLPDARSITVHGESEEFMLDCSISMRAEDGEFRIANPFGKGYSLVLEQAFMDALKTDRPLENWLNNWRESVALNDGDVDPGLEAEPFDNPWNRKLYPQLIPALRTDKFRARSLERLYSAVEWALFYANERSSAARRAVSLLQLTPEAHTPRLIAEAASALGVETPNQGFLRVSDDSLDKYLDGIPEMPTALAIAILSARSEKGNPLTVYAPEHPDIARNLYQMKKERDISSHGKGRGTAAGQSGRNEMLVKELISSLIPEISFGETLSNSRQRSEAVADARFEARTSLIQYYGYSSFNKELSEISQERLVDAECFLSTFSEGEDALPFIGDLYAVLQNELSRRTEPASIRAASDKALSEAILEKSERYGIAPLPSSLSTVKPTNIRKALQGRDETTLGAVAVAFMLTSEEDDVGDILTRQTSFFDDIGEIITARGHLNEIKQLDRDEIDQYRSKAYKTIETLMG